MTSGCDKREQSFSKKQKPLKRKTCAKVGQAALATKPGLFLAKNPKIRKTSRVINLNISFFYDIKLQELRCYIEVEQLKLKFLVYMSGLSSFLIF